MGLIRYMAPGGTNVGSRTMAPEPRSRIAGTRISWCRPPLPSLISIALVSAAAVLFVAGCGGSPEIRPEEEVVVEKALQAALGGERTGFTALVAPSFLAQARAEMPDSGDETLGGVLIAGFLEDIPFAGMIAVEYDAKTSGDESAVYVWGVFLDDNGAEMRIGEAEALRVPLVREDGRWYLDLLDL